MSPRRIRLPLSFVVLILISAGNLMAAPRQKTPDRREPPLVLRVLDLLPERFESWIAQHVFESTPQPSELKCSGGIDPDGKPCPPKP